MEKVVLAKERDFGELVSDSFNFLKQHFKPLISYVFSISIVFVVISAGFNMMAQVSAQNAVENFGTGDLNGPLDVFAATSSAWVYQLFVAFFGLLSSSTVTLVTLLYIKYYYENGHQVPEKQVIWEGFKENIVRFVLVMIVASVVLMIGLMLCLLPGIYISPIIGIILPMVVIGEYSFGSAVNDVFTLIKDHWWKTFGAMFIMVFVIAMAVYALVIPGQLIVSSSALLSGSRSLIWVGSMLMVLGQSLAHFLYILPTITMALAYFSLREAKEGAGLLDRMDSFGQGRQDDLPREEY